MVICSSSGKGVSPTHSHSPFASSRFLSIRVFCLCRASAPRYSRGPRSRGLVSVLTIYTRPRHASPEISLRLYQKVAMPISGPNFPEEKFGPEIVRLFWWARGSIDMATPKGVHELDGRAG